MKPRLRLRHPVELEQHHLDILMMNSVRYALGRRSYLVGETARLVSTYLEHLSENARNIIRADILDKIAEHDRQIRLGLFSAEHYSVLGDENDAWTWLNLLKELENDKR